MALLPPVETLMVAALVAGALIGALLLAALWFGTEAWIATTLDGRFRWPVVLLPAHLPLAVVVLALLGKVFPHLPLLVGLMFVWTLGLGVAWTRRPVVAQ